MSANENIKNLGIELPNAPKPAGNYIGGVQVGNLLFLSGAGPHKGNGEFVIGKVPSERTIEEAYEAARIVGLNQLANLKALIGDLDRVKRVVKVLGMVNADPDFKEHPAVMDGFSDLMAEVFGESGRGARSAVGMGSLPFQITVEVELIVELAE